MGCCDIFRAETRSSLKLQLQFVVVVLVWAYLIDMLCDDILGVLDS